MINLIGKFTRTVVVTATLLYNKFAGAIAKEFSDLKFTIIFWTDASLEFWNPR